MGDHNNATVNVFESLFTMGSIDLNPEAAYVTVVVGSLIYLFALCSNLLLLGVIAAHMHLHQPMYILLFSLSFNEIVGVTAMIPPVLSNILSEENRRGTFLQCLFQALALHWYAGLSFLILTAMAFDRYVAICHPLRYHAIITKGVILHVLVWCCITNALLVGSVFGLTLRFPFCSTAVSSFYCDNMTILRITCARDISLNNVYGLFITGFYHGLAVTSIVFSYTCILVACFKNTEAEARSKALSTCATHFLLFVVYECSALMVVIVYRIPQSPPTLKKFMAMSFVVIPSCLNPIIYGAKTKEIKQRLMLSVNKIFHQEDNPKQTMIQTVAK